MTAAGLDPSRIQERATLLAKVHGAKRKRPTDMDVDMDDEGADGEEGDWMDVDGEDTPNKRSKGNAGGVVAVNRREPRTNRQLAGMRDEAVCTWLYNVSFQRLKCVPRIIASIKSSQTAQSWTKASQHACQGWRERSCYQSQNGVLLRVTDPNFANLNSLSDQPRHLFGTLTLCYFTVLCLITTSLYSGQTQGWKNRPEMSSYHRVQFVYISVLACILLFFTSNVIMYHPFLYYAHPCRLDKRRHGTRSKKYVQRSVPKARR